MLKRIFLVFLALFVLLLLSLAIWSRTSGVTLTGPDNQQLGWSADTGEWLFLGYPTGPQRRDGPYVLREGDAYFALDVIPRDGGSVEVVRTPVEGPVEVVMDDGDAATPLSFDVPLHGAHGHAREATRWPMPERLLAVSDLEGEFEAFTRLLRGNGVIDPQLHWQWGSGHLVLVGDMVDRGDNVVPLLWLVYRLEAEARAAGGAVHYLLGNHEQYLLQGRPKYLHPKYHGTIEATGLDHGALWSADSELGRWLRTRPVMVQVGDNLFVHGGIGPLALDTGYSIEAIDALAARYMDVKRGDTGARDAVVLLHKSGGLLKYRGLAVVGSKHPRADAADVQRALTHFGVHRIVIGHTPTEHVGQDYDGRVIRTDVHHAGGTSEGVLFESGKPWRVDTSGRRSPLVQAVTPSR
ncbi:metallophosphoesterase [Lysobacter sp. F60174L2]|uniref:metallophosphoesterase n=1 Tax=Lysobacter sp. F60174L2 TaxID=3459295 RepID=UPI00403D666D